jgi:hypothetical protein
MATTLKNVSLAVSLTGQLTGAATVTPYTLQFPLAFATLVNQLFTSGAGAAAAVNQAIISARSLTATSNETLDLYAFGAANDVVGNAITLATIKIFIVQNTAAVEADSITLGQIGSTAQWTSFMSPNTAGLIIPGGGCICMFAPGATGLVVGASTTNHQLKVVNNSASNTVAYNIIAIGATS